MTLPCPNLVKVPSDSQPLVSSSAIGVVFAGPRCDPASVSSSDGQGGENSPEAWVLTLALLVTSRSSGLMLGASFCLLPEDIDPDPWLLTRGVQQSPRIQ